MTWKGFFETDDFDNRVRFVVRNIDLDNDKVTTIAPMVFTSEAWSTAGAERTVGTFEGRMGEGRAILQAFADLAWQLGIRPSEMADYQRQNDSQRRHLEDMRVLVFAAASTDPPK